MNKHHFYNQCLIERRNLIEAIEKSPNSIPVESIGFFSGFVDAGVFSKIISKEDGDMLLEVMNQKIKLQYIINKQPSEKCPLKPTEASQLH